MTYLEICILGWNLNAFMFTINFFVAIRHISYKDKSKLEQESLVLQNLKNELDKYYPHKAQETLLTYLIPFTAFFRISFRFVEMYFFFQKNQKAKMFDYMVYKYKFDIQKAKNK